MTTAFSPSPEIRSFDGKRYAGKKAVLHCGHTSNGSQYVSIEQIGKQKQDHRDPAFVSGWVDAVLGPEKSEVELVIDKVKLIEHMNGGRSSDKEATTYKAFFNAERKADVLAYWSGGLIGRLRREGGDPDQADVVVTFKSSKEHRFVRPLRLEGSSWGITAPEEWYSELHQQTAQRLLDNRVWPNAEAAKAYFKNTAVDDLFGTRFFPVLCFTDDKLDIAKDVAGYAKGQSKPILTAFDVPFGMLTRQPVGEGRVVLIGTRCKPYEFEHVIDETYNRGGFVIKDAQWDWD